MSAATTSGQADQRREAIRRLAWTMPLTALAFAVIGPFIGMLIVLCIPPYVMLTVSAVIAPPLLPNILLLALLTAYQAAVLPAAFTGLWVALLQPFAATRKHFYAGAAAIGATSTWLFTSLRAPAATDAAADFGIPLFLAAIGAVAAVATAWLITSWPFGLGGEGRKARRDRLARERAQRIAKARA